MRGLAKTAGKGEELKARLMARARSNTAMAMAQATKKIKK
jgi:hypothetical protein